MAGETGESLMAYQVWAFTQAGVKTAYLENAYDIQRSVKAAATKTLVLFCMVLLYSHAGIY